MEKEDVTNIFLLQDWMARVAPELAVDLAIKNLIATYGFDEVAAYCKMVFQLQNKKVG